MNKMDNIMLHLCFLEAPKSERSVDGKPIRKTYSYDLEQTGLTFDQVTELCEELTNHKTIAAWITGGSVEKVNEKNDE